MSVLTDFFEGNWSNLGTDFSHAPSSFLAHPQEQLELGLGLGAIAAPFVLPEIGAALGGAELAGGLGADAAFAGAELAPGVGIGFDAAGGLIGGDALALGGADLAGGALSFAPELGADALSFAPSAFDITGAGLGSDVLSAPGIANFDTFGAGAADISGTSAGITGADAGFAAPSASSGAGVAPTGAGATTGTAAPSFTQGEEWAGLTGAGPNAAGGGGGIVNTLGGWGNIGKWALAGAPLALALGMGPAQLPSSAQQLQGQATALSQQGQADLASARAGNLNAGQTAVLGQMKQDLTNKWRQALFDQGVQDPTKDTRWPQIEAVIDSQVTQQTATMIQQNMTNALAETGQASAALNSIAQMQLSSDQQFTNNLINATKSLGLAAGLSSGAKITIGA